MPLDVIIGGGFAGLATATALAERGRRVLLLERRSFLGGRAYSITDKTTGDSVDNGQHLMMGCYHETLAFLRRIGSVGNLRFQTRARVDFLHETEGSSSLQCPSLPAPLHLVFGLARLRSLGWKDRFSALRVGLAVRSLNGASEQLEDTTVSEWLDKLGQSPRLKERFWGPMALATLNELPERASADMFARVIKDAFLQTRRDSQIVISKVGLSDLYTGNALAFINERDGMVRLNVEVERIEFENTRATAVVLRDGERIESTTVTSAVPPQALARLLPDEMTSNWSAFRDLCLFKNSPIVSINLWFDREVTDLEFVGLIGANVDWVFNKNAIAGRPGPRQHLAIVISGAHAVSKLNREQLVDLATEEVRRFFPAARDARLLHSFVVREQDATISHTIGVARLRPAQHTPIPNFLLAGDWTATGLPATIEGAVVSGHECARLILERTPDK